MVNMRGGLGGLPAPRPDQQAAPPPAIGTPGSSSGIFRGRLVVVSGPVSGGTGASGVFVYQTAPGAGTLVASVAPSNGTDPYGNAYLSGVAAYQTLGGIAVRLVNGEILFYSAPSQAGPYTQQGVLSSSATATTLATASNLATLNLLNSALATLNVPLQLPNATPPATVPGGVGLYATGGNLQFAAADGNDYNTGRKTVVNFGQTISSTAPASILSWPVAAGTYRFRAWIIFHGGSAAGTGLFATSGPAVSLCTVSWENKGNGAAVTVNTAYQAALGLAGFGSQTLSTTTSQMMEMEATVTFTASGTFAVTCAEGTSGDTVIIAGGSTLEVMPVN